MYILHSAMVGNGDVLVDVATREGVLAKILTGAVIVLGGVAAFLLGGPVGLALYVGGVVIVAVVGHEMGVNVFKAVENVMDSGIRTVSSWFGEDMLPKTLYLPLYSYTPEEIFKGRIRAFDVNFFSSKEIKEKKIGIFKRQYYEDENGEILFEDENGKEVRGYRVTAGEVEDWELREEIIFTISQWYRTIRNICLVAMLSVLVYIGIRILLSSIASDKAKYKQMLMDWLIGLCLLFVMHYIMAFSVAIVEKIIQMITTSTPEDFYEVVIEKTSKLEKEFKKKDLLQYVETENDDYYIWPTDLMGYLRVTLQMQTPGMRYVGEVVCFLMLVVFTIMFTFTYFRRFLYMAFLTVISPLVALTYCIDKANDGKAQGFNTWLKEYMFNLLIQPMHLLLYYILISSAFATMGKNVVYSIVALAFMLPAEKLLRNLFGFEKAKTPGFLGGATVAVMMGGVNKLTGFAGRTRRVIEGSTENNNEDHSGNGVNKIHSVDTTKEMLGEEENQKQEEFKERPWRSQYDPRIELEQENGDDDRQSSDFYDSIEQSVNSNGFMKDSIEQPINTNGVMRDSMDAYENRLEGNKEKSRENKFTINLARGTRSVATTMKNTGKRILKSAPKTLKGLATGVAVGSAATIAGTAVAASSGDPGKVATAATAGISGGYVAGKAAMNNNKTNQNQEKGRMLSRTRKDSLEDKKKKMEKKIQRMKEDERNRIKLEEELGRKKTDEIMKKGGNFEKFIKNGIDKMEDIQALQKMIDNGNVRDVDHATAVYNQSKRMGRKDLKNMTKEDKNKWKETFKEEYKNVGAEEEKATETADRTIRLVEIFQDNKNN